MTQAALSIVIPAFNAAASLPATLRALDEGRESGLIREILVVDGASGDPTARMLAREPVELVHAGSPGRGRQLSVRAIATSAADFLIIGLDRLRKIGMSNPTDVGFVHAHAKGHGRHHDQPVLGVESRLDDAAVFGLHPAVIGAGIVTVAAQRLRQCFGLGAGAAIDDAGLPLCGRRRIR